MIPTREFQITICMIKVKIMRKLCPSTVKLYCARDTSIKINVVNVLKHAIKKRSRYKFFFHLDFLKQKS